MTNGFLFFGVTCTNVHLQEAAAKYEDCRTYLSYIIMLPRDNWCIDNIKIISLAESNIQNLNSFNSPFSHFCQPLLLSKMLLFSLISRNIPESIACDELPTLFQPFSDQCSHHIETSQLICSTNQLAGFCMMGTLIVKGLISCNLSFSYSDPRL